MAYVCIVYYTQLMAYACTQLMAYVCIVYYIQLMTYTMCCQACGLCYMYRSHVGQLTHLKWRTVWTSSMRSLHLSIMAFRLEKTEEFLAGQGHRAFRLPGGGGCMPRDSPAWGGSRERERDMLGGGNENEK